MSNNSDGAKTAVMNIMNRKSFVAWVTIFAIVIIAVSAGKYWNSIRDNSIAPTGTYVIEDIKFLTSISSATRDYFLKQEHGAEFEFYEDGYYYGYTDTLDPSLSGKSFLDVTYKEVALGNVINPTNGGDEDIDLSKYTKTKAYEIFSKDVETGYTVYRLDDEVWLSYMNPNSELQYPDYIISLERDELRNQSASEILSWLKAKDYPITEPTTIDGKNDPEGILNTANGYISKVKWIDSRGVKPQRCHVSVEVFNTRADCEKRKDSLEELYAHISSNGYYFFNEGRVLMTVQNGITQKQSEIYGEALLAMKQGELPKYKGGE